MKNIHVSRLSSEVLDEIFSRAKTQADYIIALYRHCVPNFDRITTVENTPRCSKQTWLEICRRAQAFDTQHHKKVLPGGCWMNSGFSTGFSFEGKEYKLPYMTVVWETQPDHPDWAPLSRGEIEVLGQFERDLESAYEGAAADAELGAGSGIPLPPLDTEPARAKAISALQTVGYSRNLIVKLEHFIQRIHLNLSPRLVNERFPCLFEEFCQQVPMNVNQKTWQEWIYSCDGPYSSNRAKRTDNKKEAV